MELHQANKLLHSKGNHHRNKRHPTEWEEIFANHISSKWLMSKICKEYRQGTSLVLQWLRIRLPMQGTRVRSLVQENPTCHRATKPVRHNYSFKLLHYKPRSSSFVKKISMSCELCYCTKRTSSFMMWIIH